MPLLVQDELAASRLRRMKLTATALLVVAAALYVLSFSVDAHGFLRAGSEAAMVGGFADWFAVTALFRRPLGLPIPHTGLVPRKKDDLALKLGEFVTGHFLTREVVVEQLQSSRIVPRFGVWVAEPAVATRLAREIAFNASVLIDAVDERELTSYCLQLLRVDARSRAYAPVVGQFVQGAVQGQVTKPLGTVVAGSLADLFEFRRQVVVDAVWSLLDQNWIGRNLVPSSFVQKQVTAAAALLRNVERNPDHPLRGQIDEMLMSMAGRLQGDAELSTRLQTSIVDLIDQPWVQDLLASVISDTLGTIRTSLAEEGGDLQARIASMVVDLGGRLQSDEAFRARADALLEGIVGHAVENYGDELTSLIRTQVARWDATSASERIELAVGRDLQFIRINGTAVGALAGIAIHTATLLTS